jgi:O-antigen/teichoic acid export membrane protein
LLVAWTAGALLANLFFKEGFRFRPFFKPILPPDLKLYRILLPLLWIDLASTIYFRSDLIILRSLGVSDTDIGQYAAAYRLIEATILVASPISIIIFRKIRLLHKNPLLQKKYIAKSLLIGTLFGFFGLAFLELAAKPLVHLTYGEQYAQAGALLPIVAPGQGCQRPLPPLLGMSAITHTALMSLVMIASLRPAPETLPIKIQKLLLSVTFSS